MDGFAKCTSKVLCRIKSIFLRHLKCLSHQFEYSGSCKQRPRRCKHLEDLLAPRSGDHRTRPVNELSRDSKKPSKTHQGNEADIDCNEDCTVSSSGFRFDFSSLLPSSVDSPYGLGKRCNVV